MRRVAPVADADDHVRLEPAVVPLLLLRRLEVHRVDVDPELTQARVEQVALRGQPAGRGRIVVEHQDLHRGASLSRPCARARPASGSARTPPRAASCAPPSCRDQSRRRSVMMSCLLPPDRLGERQAQVGVRRRARQVRAGRRPRRRTSTARPCAGAPHSHRLHHRAGGLLVAAVAGVLPARAVGEHAGRSRPGRATPTPCCAPRPAAAGPVSARRPGLPSRPWRRAVAARGRTSARGPGRLRGRA